MTVTERQFRQAEEDGAAARRAGKPRKPPHYGWSSDAETLTQAWERSWDRVDHERKR